MPRKKADEPKDEALESEDEETRDTSSDDDLLPEAAPAPARGGSGALVAILVVFVVIVLAVAAYLHREKTQREAARIKAQQLQVMSTQLGRVKDNVVRAAKQVEGDPPNVESAIEALNTAADQLGEIALSPSATEAGMSVQLVDLQTQVRATSDTVQGRNDQYLEAVAAAQNELKTSALADVKPLAGKLDTLMTGALGDVDTPLVVHGVSSVPSGEEPAEETPKATPEAGTSNP
jgi:hypothetical protein